VRALLPPKRFKFNGAGEIYFDLSAAAQGRTQTVRVLLISSRERENLDGRTAPAAEARRVIWSVTQPLLAKGADINAKDQGEEALTLQQTRVILKSCAIAGCGELM